jgi:flagellin
VILNKIVKENLKKGKMMDVNSINNQGLNNINNNIGVNNQSTQGVANSGAVENNSKDASRLTIDDITKADKNVLSTTIRTLNEGIATTKITQDALQKQEDILNNISTQLQDAQISDMNSENITQLQRDISANLIGFNEIAQNTKFNEQTLLNKKEDEQNLNITTNNAAFSIELPNTAQITDGLVTAFRQTDFTNNDSIQQFDAFVQQSAGQISNASKALSGIEKSIETVARDAIQEQLDKTQSRDITNSVDFGKEAVDFTKNNIVSQMGFLVSSQANTLQSQSVRLLS